MRHDESLKKSILNRNIYIYIYIYIYVTIENAERLE